MATSGGANPEVSVVLAVRDGEHELTATLDSVLAQRDVDLEVVVVDDGSQDGSAALLAEASRRDPRLRILRQGPEGLTLALERGCAAARAPLIARQDVGDVSHPSRLLRQKAILDRHPEVVLVSCWTACIGPGGEPLYVETRHGEADRPLSIFEEGSSMAVSAGPSSHGSVVFRRALFLRAGGYRREFALAQDWDLWYRLGLLGKFVMVGATLYLRQLIPRSLTFGNHDLQVRFATLAREAARRRRDGGDESGLLAEAAALSARFASERASRLRRSIPSGYYHLGSLLRELGDPRCRPYFGAALRHRPWLLRAWVRWAQALLTGLPRREPVGFESPEARDMLARIGASRGGGG